MHAAAVAAYGSHDLLCGLLDTAVADQPKLVHQHNIFLDGSHAHAGETNHYIAAGYHIIALSVLHREL